MHNRLVWAVSFFIGLILLGAAGAETARAQEQERSWGIQLVADGGWLIHTRNLGKNSVTIEEQQALQTVADVEDSPFLGGGVEVLLPRHALRIKGSVNTTIGATARGLLGLCQSGDVVAPGEGLCTVEEVVDATLVDALVELSFLREGISAGLLRPIFSIGLGLRSHTFDSDLSECGIYSGPGQEAQQAVEVCTRARQIFEDGSINPLLTFGVGLESVRGPFSAYVKAQGLTTSYTGGSGTADGQRAVDMALQGGIRYRIR